MTRGVRFVSMNAGIIFKTRNLTAQNYYFKHALIQDTARTLWLNIAKFLNSYEPDDYGITWQA